MLTSFEGVREGEGRGWVWRCGFGDNSPSGKLEEDRDKPDVVDDEEETAEDERGEWGGNGEREDENPVL